MIHKLLPVLLLSVIVNAQDELTKEQFLQIEKKIERGNLCPPIAVIECDDLDEELSMASGCYAPKIEYTPKQGWWTAIIRCEPTGRPSQLRTIVEETTYIQAVSRTSDHLLDLPVVCSKNGRYVTIRGRPVNNVFCYAAPNEDQEGSGDGTVTSK